jgi:hypothetical protein
MSGFVSFAWYCGFNVKRGAQDVQRGEEEEEEVNRYCRSNTL